MKPVSNESTINIGDIYIAIPCDKRYRCTSVGSLVKVEKIIGDRIVYSYVSIDDAFRATLSGYFDQSVASFLQECRLKIRVNSREE